MTERSNAVVMHGALVLLPDEIVAAGVTASNYLADGEPRFPAKGRYRQPITHLVLHETAGDSNERPKARFLRGPFGAQLILADTGHLSCHADLAEDILWHGNQLNGCGPGVEVVNPYNPIYDLAPYRETIPAQWWTWVPSLKSPGIADIVAARGWTGVPRAYCLPTLAQMNALRCLVPWLCRILGIPYVFPTLGLSQWKPRIPGWNAKPAARPGQGVVAHCDFASHADGRYLVELLIKDAAAQKAHTCA